MTFQWQILVDLGIISVALLLATFIRARIPFFQKYLIPNSITAGFLLLPFYNYAAPALGLHTHGLENLVFHLLSISFIAMTLRTYSQKTSGRKIVTVTVNIMSQYGIQAFFGLAIGLILFFTIMPQLFPGMGLFLPLGFCLGPGQAFAIGKGWEQFGVFGGGTVGLTFGAIGYLWASFGGITLINIAIRRGWLDGRELELLNRSHVRKGVYNKDEMHVEQTVHATQPEAIDPLAFNFSYVFGTYLLTFLALKGLTWLLSLTGKAGSELAWNLWGITFIFAAIMALVVKGFLKKIKVEHTVDNATMNRLSGFSVDLMVASAIGAISIQVVTLYWIPILIMSVAGGLITTFSHLWLSSRLYSDHIFTRTILIFGTSTGTLPTGLALLRIIDPEFESPVARDYTMAMGMSFVIAIPLILSMNLPAYGFAQGNPVYYWGTLGLYAAFILLLLLAYRVLAGSRSFMDPSKLWLPEEAVVK